MAESSITAENLFRRAALRGAGQTPEALVAMFNITGASGPGGVPRVLRYQQAGYLDVGTCPQVYGVPDDCGWRQKRPDGTCVGGISAKSIANYCPPGMEGQPVFLSTSSAGRQIEWMFKAPREPTEEEEENAILALIRKLTIKRTVAIVGGTALAVGGFLFFKRGR